MAKCRLVLNACRFCMSEQLLINFPIHTLIPQHSKESNYLFHYLIIASSSFLNCTFSVFPL